MTLSARVEYGIRMRFGRRLVGITIARAVAVAAIAVAGVTVIVACTAEDETFRAAPSYVYDASTFDRAAPPTLVAEAAAPNAVCGDAGSGPPRLLVVNRERPELAAFNLETQTVDGRYELAEAGVGLTSSVGNADPWLIDQTNDRVIRLDPREPWRPRGTWDVHGDDGDGSSEPAVVVQVSCTKAYVVRANRDRIAIIDPSQAGGAPTGFVDLSGLRAPGDNGTLDLSTAVWVPAKKKVFVLAGNLDRAALAPPFGLTCTPLRPSIFAIDIATDEVVSLAGKGAAGSIELTGYAPVSLLYDAPFDRLVALNAGCYAPPGDGSAGQLRRGAIEQVDLATGAVKTLLSLEGSLGPSGLVLLDGDHAVVTFERRAFFWNPQRAALGAEVPGGLDRVALDGLGGVVAARRRPANDGGTLGLDLLRLTFDLDAGASEVTQVFATDPFASPGGGAASLEPWPHR